MCLSQPWKYPSMVEHVVARYHSVVCQSVQVVCWIPASLLPMDWSLMDGSSVNHCCDPNSVQVKADLSASFPRLWASTLLWFFWGTRWGITAWNQRCYFARNWVVAVSCVCIVLSLDNCQRHICSWHKQAFQKKRSNTDLLFKLLVTVYLWGDGKRFKISKNDLILIKFFIL